MDSMMIHNDSPNGQLITKSFYRSFAHSFHDDEEQEENDDDDVSINGTCRHSTVFDYLRMVSGGQTYQCDELDGINSLCAKVSTNLRGSPELFPFLWHQISFSSPHRPKVYGGARPRWRHHKRIECHIWFGNTKTQAKCRLPFGTTESVVRETEAHQWLCTGDGHVRHNRHGDRERTQQRWRVHKGEWDFLPQPSRFVRENPPQSLLVLLFRAIIIIPIPIERRLIKATPGMRMMTKSETVRMAEAKSWSMAKEVN